MNILLNGETVDLQGPITIDRLLTELEIDGRRVAVEHNLTVVKRIAYDTTELHEGDQVEIVNFVGGG